MHNRHGLNDNRNTVWNEKKYVKVKRNSTECTESGSIIHYISSRTVTQGGQSIATDQHPSLIQS